MRSSRVYGNGSGTGVLQSREKCGRVLGMGKETGDRMTPTPRRRKKVSDREAYVQLWSMLSPFRSRAALEMEYDLRQESRGRSTRRRG